MGERCLLRSLFSQYLPTSARVWTPWIPPHPLPGGRHRQSRQLTLDWSPYGTSLNLKEKRWKMYHHDHHHHHHQAQSNDFKIKFARSKKKMLTKNFFSDEIKFNWHRGIFVRCEGRLFRYDFLKLRNNFWYCLQNGKRTSSTF